VDHPEHKVYSSDGLVQPLCFILGAVKYDGERILRQGIGTGLRHNKWDIQYGPRQPVYEQWLYGRIGKELDTNQHGWSRQSIGQHFRGTFMAKPKVWMCLPEQLWECAQFDGWI